MRIAPPESRMPAGYVPSSPVLHKAFARSSPARAVQRGPHCCHWRGEQSLARTHCQPPFLIGWGTWQNWMVSLGTKLGCRGRDGKAHTTDFPSLSVPFCRTMMFTSKLLTLTFCETQAELSSPEGTLAWGDCSLTAPCHVARAEPMVCLWDIAQAFHVTSMRKKLNVG